MYQSVIYISTLGLVLVIVLAFFCPMTCKNARLGGSNLNNAV